jgi:2-C-methyl-D-erythritol 4-phosphate cytidylyltransferase
MKKIGAIIVAAGASRRMGGMDKIFADIAGKPLLTYSVEVFQRCDSIDQIVIVLNKQRLDEGLKLARKCDWFKVSDVCSGGNRRQDSVEEGINRLVDCKWVVIHDGARPCLSQSLIETGLAEARSSGAAIPALPILDTIKAVSPDRIVEDTLPRERLYIAQTPQVFRLDIISEAYSKVRDDVTDDASMAERLGYKVKVYPGSVTNIKITTPDDLILAEAILKKGVLH